MGIIYPLGNEIHKTKDVSFACEPSAQFQCSPDSEKRFIASKV